MRIGVPLETKAGEFRVAATPETVKKYISAGHSVFVQSNAGLAASVHLHVGPRCIRRGPRAIRCRYRPAPETQPGQTDDGQVG